MMEGELPSYIRVKHVKARKKHKCYECGREMYIGYMYVQTIGVWEGQWEEYKTCRPCELLRAELEDLVMGAPPFGELMEWKSAADEQQETEGT